MAIFAAATVVLGLGGWAHPDLGGLSAFFYALAAGVYLAVIWAAWLVLRPCTLRVVDGADRWWPSHAHANPSKVREQMLDDVAEAYRENRIRLDEKAAPLKLLLFATAAEAILVALSFIASLA